MDKPTAKLLSVCLAATILFSIVGCGKRRLDPRANPDFNEAALKDPGAAKPGPINGKIKKQ